MYKSVKKDLTAFYDSKYQYSIGKGDENKKLKKDQSIECGEGWHFTNLWEAISFSSGREYQIISAEKNIKDILSVHKKVRVKKFKNVKIVNYFNKKRRV